MAGPIGDRRGGEMGGVMNGRGTRGAASAGAGARAAALGAARSGTVAPPVLGAAVLVAEAKKSSNASVAGAGWARGATVGDASEGGGLAKEATWDGRAWTGPDAEAGGGARGVIGLEVT